MRKIVVLGLVFVGIAANGSNATGASITLKRIEFPAALGGTKGSTTAPVSAPLSQAIVFEFNGAPQFPSAVDSSIRITVDPGNTKGQPVGQAAFGDFEIDGNRVIFRPRLPNDALPPGFSPGTDIASDLGLPGLLPETTYRIEVALNGPNSIANLDATKVLLPLTFTTKPAVAGPLLVSSLYSNAPAKPPKADKDQSKPKPGTTGIHPNLFSDPAGLFTNVPQAKRPPFRVRFLAPVDPQPDNVSGDRLRVRVVANAAGETTDEIVPCEVILTSNSQGGAGISIYPLSILPFGATIRVEVSDLFRSLLGVAKNDGSRPEGFLPVANYRVADDPTGGQPIFDRIVEAFDDADHQDSSITVSEGLQLASWNSNPSGVLRASSGFGGSGNLGRFEPSAGVDTIELDTDFQTFPLFSGATPEAVPGTVVKGGVFDFSDFRLPPNTTLRARGSNPLVITCTGECIVEGRIDANGAAGTTDVTFDSAIAPAPGGTGGPGAGRGGAGHPVQLPTSGKLQFMQTPQFGESGFAPKTAAAPNPQAIGGGGGGGGQSGATLPWAFTSTACADPAILGDGSRGAGGGGGSFNSMLPNVGATSTNGLGPEPTGKRVSARRGAVGVGNNLPTAFNPALPIPGEPQCYQATPGNPTNAVARVNPNDTFAAAYAKGLIYDNPLAGNPALMPVANSVWANAKKITLFGDAGPMVFNDADTENDFIGPGGEVAAIRGGQGGGGGGSRTEGLSQICKTVIFNQLSLPFTVNDAKGAGGGGGGGAVLIQALGKIELKGALARITARGGNGGGAEQIGDGSRGGNGGGGSGGCIILQSAVRVVMDDPALPANYALDVSPGYGQDAAVLSGAVATGVPGGEVRTLQVGDGGPGGPGIVQIHAPDVSQVDTLKIGADVNYSMYNIESEGAFEGLDRFDPLVPVAKTPTPLSSVSVARSTWFDIGLVTADFRPPVVTEVGPLAGPIFGVPGIEPFFVGTDPATGYVETDAAGNVLATFGADIEVDSPDLAQADFIPNGPKDFQTVRVEFQGADASETAPGLPDLATATGWETDVRELNGKRFLRWQVTFDLAAGNAAEVSPTAPRPAVNLLRVPFRY